MEAALKISALAGANAHYYVAQVIKQMFAERWVYRHPMGWRARTETTLLMGPEAAYYIRRKLSEDVAGVYDAFSRAQEEANEIEAADGAKHIAQRLRNHTYKTDIIEEAASLFLEH